MEQSKTGGRERGQKRGIVQRCCGDDQLKGRRAENKLGT